MKIQWYNEFVSGIVSTITKVMKQNVETRSADLPLNNLSQTLLKLIYR